MSVTDIPVRVRIDVVLDPVCPWCAIGLHALERAIERVGDAVAVDLHFQPFELNPGLGPDGEDLVEHLVRKYGISPAEIARNQAAIAARGAAVGFAFGPRTRIVATFDAHRLLRAAAQIGPDTARTFAHALLKAYFTEGEDIAAPATLARLAVASGIDAQTVRDVLGSDRYAAEVREREAYYAERGIRSVPAVILQERHLISGGQPPEVFEQALRQLAGIA
ncbi:MAG TPA: DsbA family oxidoreductase [Dokdonella sp.]|uniref:DsbA family oxidoreductase n=1 Tax=Dokdonella sp. TaxID=2291710 RepID=UPI002B6FEAE2|nr:DsbA family oxidoreductase [Dokdonella sp.]HUD42253.1 DsbA family oxidoreductase [Dokdonella sp.]